MPTPDLKGADIVERVIVAVMYQSVLLGLGRHELHSCPKSTSEPAFLLQTFPKQRNLWVLNVSHKSHFFLVRWCYCEHIWRIDTPSQKARILIVWIRVRKSSVAQIQHLKGRREAIPSLWLEAHPRDCDGRGGTGHHRLHGRPFQGGQGRRRCAPKKLSGFSWVEPSPK